MDKTSSFLITENDSQLVQSLVAAQFPQYADLPVTAAATGWDNVIFRLGNELAVRLPRRLEALVPQEAEFAWQNTVIKGLTVAAPRIIHIGSATDQYPFSWAITNWMEGIRSMSFTPEQRDNCAQELGKQLALLHQIAPDGAPVNPYRGVPFTKRAEVVGSRLSSTPALVSLKPLWQQALRAPLPSETKYWCHGDIHPGNYVLNQDATLKGIIDFGDVTSGDPAVDLATAWVSFTAEGRERFFASYFAHCATELAQDAGLLWRARGWCIAGFVSAVLTSDLSTDDFVLAAEWAAKQLLIK